MARTIASRNVDTPPPFTPDPEGARHRREEWRRQLAPVGIMHAMVVDQIARAAERLRHAEEWEDNAPPGDPAALRYLAQAERGFWRAMAEHRRIERANRAAAKVDASRATKVEVVAPAPSNRPVDGWPSRVERGAARPAVEEGTGVKVDDVMAGLSQGGPPAEILSRRPGLKDADNQACRERVAAGG